MSGGADAGESVLEPADRVFGFGVLRGGGCDGAEGGAVFVRHSMTLRCQVVDNSPVARASPERRWSKNKEAAVIGLQASSSLTARSSALGRWLP